MDLKRAKAIGKLALLFGTPLAVIFGLFSCGVYCGHQQRHSITSFEHDVLGLDVEVVAADIKPGEQKPADKPSTTSSTTPTPKPETTPEPQPAPTPAPVPAPTPAPDTTKTPPPPVEPQPAVTPPSVPDTKADPLEGELARLHHTPLKIRVEVLVHDDLVAAQREMWIDYVQRTVARASEIWQAQFGIELELVAVRRWSEVDGDASAIELLEALEAEPREGADIVLGFSQRVFDDRVASQAPPADADAYNGTTAVVYATPGHHDAHLRTLLFEVARLFSARPVETPSDPAYTSGSWMSYAPSKESDAFWIDAANRARVLEHKMKPFAPATEEDHEE